MTKPLVDILLPVYNEQAVLEKSVHRVMDFMTRHLPDFRWVITIGDNASTDNTLAIARELEQQHDQVRVYHIPIKGRGIMVKKAWSDSKADIVTYMDIDISTDLAAFGPLVRAIHRDGYHFSLGSRQLKGAKVTRSVKREFISRGYIVLLKLLLAFPFSDAQCGFKAADRQAFLRLCPQIQDNEWFFDTELLYLAHKQGYKVKEVPVTWVEDRDSRVRIMRTALQDIAGCLRMFKYRWRKRG